MGEMELFLEEGKSLFQKEGLMAVKEDVEHIS
jgi:hypothetical protein